MKLGFVVVLFDCYVTRSGWERNHKSQRQSTGIRTLTG